MTEEILRKLIPVTEGFKFECQMCGNCCVKANCILSLDELHFFREHNLGVFYYISIVKENSKLANVYPCKPPDFKCEALSVTDNRCLMYAKRPRGCKFYPFMMRVYYRQPPTYDEIKQTLHNIDLSGIVLRRFYHTLENKRWLFLGCQVNADCPGIGKGKGWRKNDIKKFILQNLFDVIESKVSVDETNESIQDMLGMKDETDVKKYFELVREVYSDDKVRLGVYKAINGDLGKLCEDGVLKTPISSDNVKVKEGSI